MDRGTPDVLEIAVDDEPATMTVYKQREPLELVLAEAETAALGGQALRDVILTFEVRTRPSWVDGWVDGENALIAVPSRPEPMPEILGRLLSPELFRRQAEGEPQGRRVPIHTHSWSWSCPIGDPDWCAEHRYAEGLRDTSGYPAIFESFARAIATTAADAARAIVEAAQSFQEAPGAAAGDEAVDEPANRRERRAAARMERQGGVFKREKMNAPGRDRWSA